MATNKKAGTGEGVPGSPIEIRPLNEDEITVLIRGMTPYIPHSWTAKTRTALPGHPDNDALREKKGPHDPEQEAFESTYWVVPGAIAGIPATAIKSAMVDACRFFEGITMTALKQLIFVVGEGSDQLVPITGTRVLREDTIRVTKGGTDLRYRNSFVNWSAAVRIRYLPSCITRESVVALLHAAGRCGVGEWRPTSPKSNTGTYGTWRVMTEAELQAEEAAQAAITT